MSVDLFQSSCYVADLLAEAVCKSKKDLGGMFLKVHKHDIFFYTFFAETESLWSQGPVTRDF